MYVKTEASSALSICYYQFCPKAFKILNVNAYIYLKGALCKKEHIFCSVVFFVVFFFKTTPCI